jgi:DNA-binding CsgD family transcriptional regulator
LDRPRQTAERTQAPPGVCTAPETIRTQVLQCLLDHAEADWAIFTTYAERGGEFHYTASQAFGDSQGQRVVEQIDGGPTLVENAWDPRSPDPEERSHFVPRIASAGGWDGIRGTRLYRDLYRKHGIHDQIRMLAYSGDTFLGWIGVMRHADRPFEEDAARELDRYASAACRRLELAERLQHRQSKQCIRVLMGAEGERIRWRSRAAKGWLTCERREFLRYLVTNGRLEGLLGGFNIQLVRLEGDGGPLWLATAEQTCRPEVDPLVRLTSRQREVAELAAVDATVDEIAAHLELSPNTVKSHLKAVYRRLDVHSRIELAEHFSSGRDSTYAC